MSDIQKSFAHIPVLKRVNFTLRGGEIHALMGGNGTGKFTLMKILTGVYQRDGGTITIDGTLADYHDTPSAERAGVAMIFQEFSLVPTLTVAQNIFLSRALLLDLGVDLDPELLVSGLSVGYMQIVKIAKALSKTARILVMDEPTSSLSETETDALFPVSDEPVQHRPHHGDDHGDRRRHDFRHLGGRDGPVGRLNRCPFGPDLRAGDVGELSLARCGDRGHSVGYGGGQPERVLRDGDWDSVLPRHAGHDAVHPPTGHAGDLHQPDLDLDLDLDLELDLEPDVQRAVRSRQDRGRPVAAVSRLARTNLRSCGLRST